MSATPRIIIIGAGLAGLACARALSGRGLSCTILDASDEIGGRVRTDRVDGFQLDRGFQVFLSGYPEAQATLDYPALKLQTFHPGALVRYAGRFHRVSDPFRRPQDALATAMSSIGSLRDKLTMLKLRQDALHRQLSTRAGGGAQTTLEALQAYGFSSAMQERFFRPFLGGVFLDQSLSTPCVVFEQVWAAFSYGAIALPQEGMGAIARQLAEEIPKATIRLRAPVARLDGGRVVLVSGERLDSDAVVLATDYATAATLRGEPVPTDPGRRSMSLYFDAAPVRGPWLMVNGDGQGPIGTASVLSEVSPAYAPAGRALVAVSLADQSTSDSPELLAAVRRQLCDWFGRQAASADRLHRPGLAPALSPRGAERSWPASHPPWSLSLRRLLCLGDVRWGIALRTSGCRGAPRRRQRLVKGCPHDEDETVGLDGGGSDDRALWLGARCSCRSLVRISAPGARRRR